MITVARLATEADVCSRCCLWYELSTFTAAASYTQWPQEPEHSH